MTLIPRIALPYRIVAGSPVVVEQDTLDDIAGCVETILRFPKGSRLELPDFGLPDQTFRERGVDVDAVRSTLERWEPRAGVLVEQDDQALAEMVAAVTVSVSTANGSP